MNRYPTWYWYWRGPPVMLTPPWPLPRSSLNTTEMMWVIFLLFFCNKSINLKTVLSLDLNLKILLHSVSPHHCFVPSPVPADLILYIWQWPGGSDGSARVCSRSQQQTQDNFLATVIPSLAVVNFKKWIRVEVEQSLNYLETCAAPSLLLFSLVQQPANTNTGGEWK